MALGVFKDQIKTSGARDIVRNLDARNVSELQALSSARAGGDPAQIATALAAAETAIQKRIRGVNEDLKKLTDLAAATGDQDLKVAVSELARTAREAQQKLLNQVTSSQRAIQTGMFDSMNASVARFTASTRSAGGDASTVATKQGLVDFNNRLTDYIGNLLQEQNKAFANIRFESLGGQSLAQLFPGAGGKGLGRQANFLTNSLLAPAGFFNADTAEGRQAAISQAIDNVEPALRKVGLSGKELEVATKELTDVLEAVKAAYKPVIDTARRLNAQQFEAARARARRAISEGRYEEADRIINDLTPYVTTRVPTSRRRRQTTEADVTPTSEAQLSATARTNLAENRDVIAGDVSRSKDRADREGNLFRRLGTFAGRALSIFGGLQFAIGGAAAAIGGIVEQANSLDRAAATVNALSGSFQGFTQVLSLATIQQQKFGGTLDQTLQGFNSLIPISKRYGADLLQLDNIARRLAVIDPIQGFQGASIALKEFFSGDITSLSRRFEIDRKTLNSIKDAGDKLQQLQKLDEVLADLGISNAVLESRTQTTAATYDRFGAVLSNTTTYLGKITQQGFAPFVENLTDAIDYTEELSVVLANEQLYINLATNLERVTRQIVKMSKELNTAVTENPLDKFVGDFVDLDSVVSKNRSTMEELVDEANQLVMQLNDLRSEEGKPLLRLFSDKDYDAIKELIDISNNTGIPVINLLEGQNPAGTGMLTVQQAQDSAAGNVKFLDELIMYLGLGYQTENMARFQEIGTLTGWAPTTAGDRGVLDPGLDPTKYFRQDIVDARIQGGELGMLPELDRKALQTTFLQAGLPYVEALKKQTQALQLLTPRYYEQTRLLEEQTGIDYINTMIKYQVALQDTSLTTDQINQILIKILGLNKQLMDVTEARIQYESDYVTQNLATTSSFGGQALNEKLVQQINQISQDNAEISQRILGQAYVSLGGGASADGMSDELKRLVATAEEWFGLTREQLYYQGQLEKRQAQLTLEANRSVSAFGALRGQISGLQVPLADAVQLAMEFNNSIQGMVSGLVGGLSLEDQLRYYQMQSTNPNAMTNDQDIIENANATINIMQQQADKSAESIEELPDLVAEAEEEKLDLAKDYQKDLSNLAKDYEEKKVDLLEDYEKDKLKLLEDYEEKKLKLLTESEVSKRENRGGFYSDLLLGGGEDLTPEQQRQASADYEAFFEEASQLRNQGQFQKADEVMNAGIQLIQNRSKMQADVATEEENIKESQEELIYLRKQLGKTSDEEDRREINRKIAKVEQDIRDSEERIARIKAVYEQTKIADDERVKQARLTEDQINKDYEDALEDRKTAYEEALEAEEKAYKKSLEDREAAYRDSLTDIETELEKSLKKQKAKTDENQAEQILSFNDLIQWQQAGYAVLEAARVAAEGGNREAIQTELTNRIRPIREYFQTRNTPGSKVLLDALDKMEMLPPSMTQLSNPTVTATLNGGMSPWADEMFRAGVLPKGTAEPGIVPFQAVILDNNTKVGNNTTATQLNTTAVETLTRIIQTNGYFRGPFSP